MRFTNARWFGAAVVIGSLMVQPAEIRAQEAAGQQREGFWWGVGVGYAFSRVGCDICSSDATGGFSGSAKAGLTLNPSLLLGLETNGWLHNDDVGDRFQTSLNALAFWYPSLASGLNVKAGVGVTWYRASDSENAITTTSLSPQIGFAYDLPVGRTTSVTPFINLIAAPFGDLQFNGELVTPSANFTLLQLGAGVTWH